MAVMYKMILLSDMPPWCIREEENRRCRGARQRAHDSPSDAEVRGRCGADAKREEMARRFVRATRECERSLTQQWCLRMRCSANIYRQQRSRR
jgi:hypothetical protein